ncbi:PHP domain-containing protein [Thermodesulfobacteriota bacterium]
MGAAPGLQVFSADLHVHTCLSPCATLDMTPMKIVREAQARGLAIIAITDHNSAENTGAVMKAAADLDLFVIPGMEITTQEEAHIVALFGKEQDALSMQELIYGKLMPGENDEDLFGIQVIANELDEVEGINNRLLIGATVLGMEAVVAEIHARQGLAVAAHINRQSYSIISQLGFIPPDLPIDALEISAVPQFDRSEAQSGAYGKGPFITGSDAHSLEQIGESRVYLKLERPDMHELKQALRGQEGRQVMEEPITGVR